MFAIYKLDRDMSGAWQHIAMCETWNGMVSFIDTYYYGYRALSEEQEYSLPCPHDFEVAIRDVHGNIYVIYELPKKYSTYHDYPDIDEDFNYLRDKYSDYKEDGIDCWHDSDYYAKEFWRMISRPNFVEYYLPHDWPASQADRQNSWYVGALHGF